MEDWTARMARCHEEQVAEGLHDSQCEYGPRLVKHWDGIEGKTYMHMCHCAMRLRVAAGKTKVPGPLIISNPTCPGCWREVAFDGDCFVCSECSVRWSSTNESDEGEFTDDYGDLGRPVEDES